MNPHKIRAVVDYIRNHGGLPTDQFGSIMACDDLLAWFGLNKMLSLDEQRRMKAEFQLIAEAQLLADQLKIRS